MAGRHRKRRTSYQGKHRAVTPKSDRMKARVAVIAPLTCSLVLYPAIARDSEGYNGWMPSLGDVIPVLAAPPAEAAESEVITDPTEVIDPPVVDLDGPAG